MPLDDAGLRMVWRRFLPGGPEAVVARYREHHRSYHGVRHLAHVVGDVMAQLLEVPVEDPGAIVAAAFFHDVVYDPRSSTNEADSAALARRTLDSWAPERLDEVERLILATRTHDATDAAASVLLDADLAVLGAEPSVYEAYRRGVRAEYAHVHHDNWRSGRAAVLQSFLDRPRIFHTAAFASREARARANLLAELTSLERPEAHSHDD
jgi:predicted metal-dependent HD superfamily phosphohydrolase